MQVEAITYKDVRGNELMYLRITNPTNGKEVLVNIGAKTYKAVKDLTAQPELPLPNRIENNKVTNTPQSQAELQAKVNR